MYAHGACSRLAGICDGEAISSCLCLFYYYTQLTTYTTELPPVSSSCSVIQSPIPTVRDLIDRSEARIERRPVLGLTLFLRGLNIGVWRQWSPHVNP